jgi:LmbE family N-acetylglucosaminyl deacetylase
MTISFQRRLPCSHPLRYALTFMACCITGLSQPGRTAEMLKNPVILPELRRFAEMGSVLYVAAHPDDENTQLIAYLARGRFYRTAYLSLTRGDGGQNVLGPEFGEELGVIRTQELLAARRIDGGRQFFSRAIDFGFSKDYQETLRIWDRQQVLSDIVQIIREYRPDVIITRFSTQPGGTHGHHTASAVLALEAFKLAGDTNAFPDQLHDLTPWQPKRILWNAGGFQRGGNNTNSLIRIDVSGADMLTGESFGDIAARSRAMHKTQGFDNFRGFGGSGPRSESFQLLEGEAADKDIMDGVDTTWSRVQGGNEIRALTEELIAQFSPQDPAASVPALLKIRNLLAALPPDPVVNEKREQLDRILQACLGLSVETTVPNAEVVPGESLSLHHVAEVQSRFAVRWMAVRYPGNGQQTNIEMELRPDQPAVRDSKQVLPAAAPLTQPYWLRQQPGTGMFRVDDPRLIGRPENPPGFPVEFVFEVGSQTLVVPDQPVQVATGSSDGERRRKLDVISPVVLKFASDVSLFAPDTSKPVEVEVVASRPDVAGMVQLEAPAGWKVSPESQSFRLEAVGDRARLKFSVTAPKNSGTARIMAHARIGNAVFSNEREEITYKHIPVQLLQPPAGVEAVDLDLAIRGKKIGYVPGAGDSVAESLKQMGYEVASLTADSLTAERLRGLDAVVIGIRAFNVHKELLAHLPVLFGYVEAGGNVIMQYNRPDGLQTNNLAPFDLRLSGDRVTDETAAMTFLAPDHPVLNRPNKITSADFDGWVQERGLYFPNRWDEHFTPIIACNDPGEAPMKGGLLVAPYGKGYFVYTGLAFFRQLPAGVPGAYRLFANLVSLGK